MKNKVFLLLIIAIILLSGCNKKSSIDGLWVVKLVKMGDQEMTPNARWTRFNADSTQQSGNGWFQHSYGTWSFNPETSKLSVVNTNGVIDTDESFKVVIKNNTMTWKRNEDGQIVEVTLERSMHLPTSYGDKLLGLWKLESTSGNGMYFNQNNNSDLEEYIFFRWDKRFVIQSEKGKINGVYNVNGHKPEVELIPYGKPLNRNFWNIEFGNNQITLKLINTDSVITRQFIRIHEFPQ